MFNIYGFRFQVSVFRCQASGRWSLATGQKRGANGQNAEIRLRGRDPTPDTRHLTPKIKPRFVNYIKDITADYIP